MQADAVQKYLRALAISKACAAVIDAFTDWIARAVYKATTIESIYLQFRKIVESIALGSLVANKNFSPLFTQILRNIGMLSSS